MPRFENPVIVLRYTPDDLPGEPPGATGACDKMRQNASMMVYNDHDVIPAMDAAASRRRMPLTYTMHGCNWPDVPACSVALAIAWLWLPRYLLEADRWARRSSRRRLAAVWTISTRGLRRCSVPH